MLAGGPCDSLGCEWKRAQRSALAVLGFAIAKLAEFVSGRNFGIDAWLVRNPGMFGAVATGRMSPLTAVEFVFSALGLFCLTRKGLTRFAGGLGALATLVSGVILVGYWYGTPLLYDGTIIPLHERKPPDGGRRHGDAFYRRTF